MLSIELTYLWPPAPGSSLEPRLAPNPMLVPNEAVNLLTQSKLQYLEKKPEAEKSETRKTAITP